MTYKNTDNQPIYKMKVSSSFYSIPPLSLKRFDNVVTISTNYLKTKLYFITNYDDGEVGVEELRLPQKVNVGSLDKFLMLTSDDIIVSNDKKLLKNFLKRKIFPIIKDAKRREDSYSTLSGKYYEYSREEIKKTITNIETYYKKVCQKLKEL